MFFVLTLRAEGEDSLFETEGKILPGKARKVGPEDPGMVGFVDADPVGRAKGLVQATTKEVIKACKKINGREDSITQVHGVSVIGCCPLHADCGPAACGNALTRL